MSSKKEHTPLYKNGSKISYTSQQGRTNTKKVEVVLFLPAGKTIKAIAAKEKVTLAPEVTKDCEDTVASAFHRYLVRTIPEPGSKARPRYFTPQVGPVETTGALL